ncbi:lysosomal acid glucosylceramidase-like isoform X2 [Bombyx mandarina]|uniref:Glucosylceramidase n=1 Tax=Bombyx mandarina TaxID=7092 RepID=A0A6J2K6D0_BOMMA|nr:lysosomal acid glucosylceramidase-like isoform X2 [Bombyx mandarina]
MIKRNLLVVGFEISLLFSFVVGYYRGHTLIADKTCAELQVNNSSVICVCNATYCDTVTREEPHPRRFMVYTSSKAGLRFKKFTSILEVFDLLTECSTTLELEPRKRYQTIHGFGGAITDSAAINWSNLKDEELKQNLIESYCGDSGIQYNMLRVPIGGTDFSPRFYTYQDYPERDKDLSNFTLAPEDLNYKLPMIKACMKASNDSIDILGSLWYPPAWMKSTKKSNGISFLEEEYYDALALYHLKFIKEYYKQGVPIWGITTTNEPLSGITKHANDNVLGWSVYGLANWIVNYLAPKIKRYDPSIKILGVDDQRFTVPLWFNAALKHVPELGRAIDGIGLHYYENELVPPEIVDRCFKNYPNLFVLSSEASIHSQTNNKVDLGSWDRAEKYIKNIIEDLNHNYTAWIDWNVCLDKMGGPVLSKTYLDSPVIVDPDAGVFYKQPLFYAMGHFSKFIPKGSKRIQSVEKYNCGDPIKHVAFSTPMNTIVVVVFNDKNKEKVVRLKLGYSQAKVLLEKNSIATVEFHNDVIDESCDCEK